MRISFKPTLLALLLLWCPPSRAAEPSLGERLEKLAPRAAGLAEVEVVDSKEIDARPGDGDLYLDVHLKILRGSGVTPSRIYITKMRGGHHPPNTPPFEPHGPVKFDTFRKGQRYWVAFASPHDWKRCPQGVVESWPQKDGPKDLEEAVAADHYAHRPLYDPQTGLTYSHRPANDKKSWRVRMEQAGKTIWELDLPGEKHAGTYDGEWRLLNRSQVPDESEYAKDNPSGVFLFAETAHHLEQGNSYRLPAGKHRLRYALNADTGKPAAVWVSSFDRSPQSTPAVVQTFDPKTGWLRREERFDFMEKGGLALGAKEESWLRKIVRTHDAKTGKLIKEETFRSTPGGVYVPVGGP